MNIADLHQKLIRVARANPPSEAVPYAFEQRILNCLTAWATVPDTWALWARALWRATAPSVAVMAVLGLWTYWLGDANNLSERSEPGLESTLLAEVDQWGENW